MPWLYLLPVAAIAAYLALSGGSRVSLPSGRKILFIGDSLTGNRVGDLSENKGTAGGNLVALLREDGNDVLVNALGARSAYSFVHGTTQWDKKAKRGKEPAKAKEQLQDAIAQGIDTAVVFLGTNDLAGLAKDNKLSATLKPFEEIVNQLREAGIEVYGIGAPHYADRSDFWPYEEGLRDGLAALYGEGFFVDAGPLTKEYRMHAGGKSAKAFAERLHGALTGEP